MSGQTTTQRPVGTRLATATATHDAKDTVQSLLWRACETPLGTFHVACSRSAITAVTLPGTQPTGPMVDSGTDPLLEEAAHQLVEWANGRRRDFDLPLAPEGTAFQRAVWAALNDIPYGETRSYGEIAAAVGRPGGARAVGQANHRNPVAPFIPCHRVVASDGGLGGYGGGLPLKRAMLELEQRHR